MHYVYIIRSCAAPEQRYIGRTENPRDRLESHNSGKSIHTSKHRPWVFETLVGLSTEEKAIAFEQYLKSGSGFAFAKKHF